MARIVSDAVPKVWGCSVGAMPRLRLMMMRSP